MKNLKIEPVFLNLFTVLFFSNKLGKRDSEILSEQLININFTSTIEIKSDNYFDLKCVARFNQNIIKGKIQPLFILESLLKKKGIIKIEIKLHSRDEKVYRIVELHDSIILNIFGLNGFSYASDSISEPLEVEFLVKNVKIKNI